MAGEIASDQEGVAVRKKRNPDGKRSLTFIYTADSGETVLGKHKTKAFSVDEAWKEFVAKHNLSAETKKTGAIAGHVELMKNKIRKPTRAELLKIAGLSDDD